MKVIIKIYSWIHKHNSRVCFTIISKYNKGIDSGRSTNYKYRLSFLQYYLLRLLLVFISLIFLKKETYYTFSNLCFQSSSNLSRPNESSFLVNLKQFLYTLFGFEYLSFTNLLPLLSEDEILKKRIDFSPLRAAVVSIIIPVHNHLDFTYNCLAAIKESCSNIPYEIIIVDDKSDPSTGKFVEENVRGVKFLRNNENLGFLQSCIKGILKSDSKYICLLNNDTQVRPGWLESLIKTIESDNRIGCVGSKLVYPNGLLQEAGGIIFKDASGSNYGRNDKHDLPRYNYAREVDYCSGASILFRRDDYDNIKGLDARFSPAYYEDTDLCFSLRHLLKKKVIYQPLSVVVHFEGVSSGKTVKEGNIKYHQKINQQKFFEKWSNELEGHHAPGNSNISSRRLTPSKTALFIDSSLPFYDQDSGSKRIFSIIKILLSDYHIIFVPSDGKKVEPYYSDLIFLGTEVLYHYKDKAYMEKELNHVLPFVNYMWLSRPEVNLKYKVIKITFPNIKWIFDTVDLNYLRLERTLNIKGRNNKLINKVNYYKSLEINLAKTADLTIAITADEEEELKKNEVSHISIIPNIHEPKSCERKVFRERSGLLFIGGYNHDPNVDAVLWLVREIMPLVWKENSDLTLTLLGSNPTNEILELSSDKVFIPGYIKDVGDYFNSARVFVAPLRYGAGMKGKIGQSLEYGLPAITTLIGAEGMNLIDGEHAIIASDPDSFASHILRLYEDEMLWNKISENSLTALADYSPEKIKNKFQKEIFI